MPYLWTETTEETRLTLWPHRSLSRRGFAVFIAASAVLAAVPLVGVLGTMVLWGLLPFLVATIALLWWALRRNERDREILETLTLGATEAHLTRQNPDGTSQVWIAPRYWTRPVLTARGGPVPDYLTLQGGPREVELGAFLTSEERRRLRDEIEARLSTAPDGTRQQGGLLPPSR